MTSFVPSHARRRALIMACALGALVALITVAALTYGFAQQHVGRAQPALLTCSTATNPCSGSTSPTATISPTTVDSSGQAKSAGAAASAATPTPTGSRPSVHVFVSISNFAFAPGVLHVRVGTTVTWTNH